MRDRTVTLIITLIFIGGLMCLDTALAFYFSDIPQTHKGSVIYVAHRYNKWCGYDYTVIEILTYSGDSHHIKFWDHIDFDLGKTYEIHTIEVYRLFLNAGWSSNEKVVEIIEIEQ